MALVFSCGRRQRVGQPRDAVSDPGFGSPVNKPPKYQPTCCCTRNDQRIRASAAASTARVCCRRRRAPQSSRSYWKFPSCASRIDALIHPAPCVWAEYLRGQLVRREKPAAGFRSRSNTPEATLLQGISGTPLRVPPSSPAALCRARRTSASRHRQGPDPPKHRPEKAAGEVTLGQQERVIACAPDQPSTLRRCCTAAAHADSWHSPDAEWSGRRSRYRPGARDSA